MFRPCGERVCNFKIQKSIILYILTGCEFLKIRLYKKPNDDLKYINLLFNHPPQILKQLTTTINDRLSRNSSSVIIFNESKLQYEDVLRKSRSKSELT